MAASERSDDRVALVTGGGSGMGAATAEAFAAAGYTVAVADIDEAGGRETVERIVSAGGKAGFVAADVGDEESVRDMVASVVSLYGRLDCAVNNAGVGPTGLPAHEFDVDRFDRVIRINLRGVALCQAHELRQMRLQGDGGAIVNVGSVNSLRVHPGTLAYSASKHAVVAMTKVAALESGEFGIRVNAVCPGTIDTPMLRAAWERRGVTDVADARGAGVLGRLGAPGEVAAATVWLCGPEASFVTGVCLPVDAGFLAS